MAGVLRRSAAQARPEVALKFSVFSESSPREIRFLPESGADSEKLRFFGSQRSGIYEYRGARQLVFFREVELPPDPQRPNVPRVQRVTVGYVDIPLGMSEALILFSTEGNWSENTIPIYRVQVFDDSVAAFPLDHVAFLNATGQLLFGTVGGRRVDLPSGMSAPVAMRPGETPIALSASIDGDVTSVYQERLALGLKQRLTVVLFPPYREDVQQVQRRLLYDPDIPPPIKRPAESQ